VVGGTWSVPPGGRLESARLRWTWPDLANAPYMPQVTAAPGLLESFLHLSGPAAIADFARRWGPLGLCDKHQLPGGHKWAQRPAAFPCQPLRTEPVARWQEWIDRANAVLRLSAALYGGGTGEDADWHALGSEEGLRVPVGVSPEYAAAHHLTGEVNSWIVLGDVRPRLWWIEVGRDDALRRPVVIAGAGLFGALAYQLLLAAGRSRGLARCTVCGREFDPQEVGRRRPQAGRAVYCAGPCAKEGARRRAERSRRA
jgi:hypothetical protein